MRVLRSFALLILIACSAGACQSYEPVPVSDCRKVVTHARSLLGEKADSWTKMQKSCEEATDEERGCVQAADSAADILRCSM